MRHFFANLRSMVAKKFPDSQVKAVGAFLFLRFLCPSIFSPDGFGLVSGIWLPVWGNINQLLLESPNEKARRALVLTAKVLQNTANGVQFGGKEQYMAPLNSFVTSYVSVLYEFFDQVSVCWELQGLKIFTVYVKSDPLESLDVRPPSSESRREKARHLAVVIRTLNASIEYLQKRDDVPKVK